MKRFGFGLDGDKGIGAPIGSEAKVTGDVSVTALISYKKGNISENNKLGRKFEAVKFTGNFRQSSISPNTDLEMTYNGSFSVQYGGKQHTSMLTPLDGCNLIETNSSPMNATVYIPSRDMKRGKLFNQVKISAGATNPNLILNPRPVDLIWQLQTDPVILPK